MKTSVRGFLVAALLAVPGFAWAHGFDLSFNSTFTGVMVASDDAQLDSQGSPTQGPNTLFYSPFNGSSSLTVAGNSYYSVVHGFADGVAGSNGFPGPSNLTATFNIISPLYYSDGTAGSMASGAQLASAGTYIQMYDRDFPSDEPPGFPGTSPGYVNVSGSTPFAAGFQTSMDDPHELGKELFLGSGSSQTDGEYGFAFDVTLTLSNGTTVVTPPLIDVFALSGSPNDFVDGAPTSQQDAATLSIFNAATAVGNAAIGHTQSWNGGANTSWNNANNWENTVAPGSTSGATSNDTAVFYSAPNNAALTIDPGRNVQTILFELNAGAFTLGSTTGSALLLTNGGSIQVTATVNNPQVVNAPLVLEGASALYTFNSDSLNNSATLSFGGSITGDAAGNTVLTLGGDNTGNNTIAGAISNGSATSLAVLVSGPVNWILSGPNTYSGGTTVNEGTLTVNSTGTLGSSTSPLAINTFANLISSTVNINGNQSVGNLSGTVDGFFSTGTLNIAAGSSLRVNQMASTTFGATLTTAYGSTSSFSTFTMQGTNSSVLEIDAPPTLGDYTAIAVNGGTLRFNLSSAPSTIGANVTVTVAAPATLELAGPNSALSGSGTASIANNGSAAIGGGLLVSGTGQTVGIISGQPTVSGGTTTYAGDTVVGTSNTPGSLIATQILQNSLTINAGSSVTIVPSDSGSDVQPSSMVAAALTSNLPADDLTTSANNDSSVLAEIQAAIASGAINSVTGLRLENRLAGIERLADLDPQIDILPLENRLLESIPNFSTADSLAIGGNPSAVPEPSTIVLTALLIVAAALLRVRAACEERWRFTSARRF